MASSYSSQGLVRALKAVSDPPVSGGPFKIEIARQAWDDHSFYVPSKGEVIVDWILTRFLKDKTLDWSSNPLSDLRYWTLLYDIISSPSRTTTSINTRPVKAWLTPLLNRIPVASILAPLLDILKGMEDIRNHLSLNVSQCLAIIWPLTVQKMVTETLLECFAALLSVMRFCGTDESLTDIGILITSSYRKSLENSANKKKIHHVFLQTHLSSWLEHGLVETSTEPYKTLLENSYAAGIETLFNLDVLRQSPDFELENNLFEALTNTLLNGLVLVGLPRIFASFIQVIKKNRNILFGQSSNQSHGTATQELHDLGMRFFASCQSLLEGSNRQTWSTRVALLSIVDEENLFNRGQVDPESILSRNVELALTVLEGSHDESRFEMTIDAVECLSAVARIDYDLILPVIPCVLPSLLFVGASHHPIQVFLDLLLNYHTKTRTMGTYVANLLDALTSQQFLTIPDGAHKVYQISLSGPLMSTIHFEHLSKSIQSFLTSSQVFPTVQFVLDYLKDTWEQFHKAEDRYDAGSGEGSRKRRRVIGNIASFSHPGFLAISFSLSIRVASVVISSIPTHSVPESTRQELYQLLTATRAGFLHRALKKACKIIHSRDTNDVWEAQVVAASVLRLRYSLDTSRSLPLQSCDDSKLDFKLLEAVEQDGLLPELNIEIFRTLLKKAVLPDQLDIQRVLDRILTYLDINFRVSESSWSGQSHSLVFGERGRTESALALLHMVIERWLPVIDSLASRLQLEKLMQVILSINIDSPHDSALEIGLQPPSLLLQALHSAQFWELRNLRTVLLASLTKATSSVEVDAENFSLTQTSSVMVAYRLMLLLPLEYFTRSSRAEFIKRAVKADILISCLAFDSESASNDMNYALTILRVFLTRVLRHVGFMEQPSQNLCDYLEHLMMSKECPSQSISSVPATLDLIELHLIELFKPSEKVGKTQAILVLLRSFAKSDGFMTLLSGKGFKVDVRTHSFMRMVQLLTTKSTYTDIPEEVRIAIRELHVHIFSLALPEMSSISTQGTPSETIVGRTGLMMVWCSILSLGQWLGSTDNEVPSFGKFLVSKALSLSSMHSSVPPDNRDNFHVTLAILLQELDYCAEDKRLAHLDFVLAVYVSFSRIVGVNGRQKMDEYISKSCRALSPSDFLHVLDLTAEAIINAKSSPDLSQYFVQLSVILLREHPTNTLKHIQNFATRCINAFAGHTVFTEGPAELRMEVLQFLAQHCSERPAALRQGDLGSIWSVLSKLLSGSRVHDEATTAEIFHKIVTIISALVRMRRDLVVVTLPLLGVVLRQLTMSVKSVRPHLGSKQIALVMDTQPRWINAKCPLGPEEGKILARLFETLTTKSIVRSHALNADTQKAESLMKPFSKHAAYVLKAYIEAMNDPLCILPSELRKELQPGLYALCSMVSDYSRDAMMVSALDAGGKATMKALWKEYEKRRYVGKG